MEQLIPLYFLLGTFILTPLICIGIEYRSNKRKKKKIEEASEYIKIGDKFEYLDPCGDGDPFLSDKFIVEIIDIKDNWVLYSNQKWKQFYKLDPIPSGSPIRDAKKIEIMKDALDKYKAKKIN